MHLDSTSTGTTMRAGGHRWVSACSGERTTSTSKHGRSRRCTRPTEDSLRSSEAPALTSPSLSIAVCSGGRHANESHHETGSQALAILLLRESGQSGETLRIVLQRLSSTVRCRDRTVREAHQHRSLSSLTRNKKSKHAATSYRITSSFARPSPTSTSSISYT